MRNFPTTEPRKREKTHLGTPVTSTTWTSRNSDTDRELVEGTSLHISADPATSLEGSLKAETWDTCSLQNNMDSMRLLIHNCSRFYYALRFLYIHPRLRPMKVPRQFVLCRLQISSSRSLKYDLPIKTSNRIGNVGPLLSFADC